jgi:hypothetical protein
VVYSIRKGGDKVISPLQVMLSQPYPAVEKHSQKIPSEDFAAVIVRMKSSGKPEKTKNAKANGLDAGFFVSGREKESRADGVVSEDTHRTGGHYIDASGSRGLV